MLSVTSTAMALWAAVSLQAVEPQVESAAQAAFDAVAQGYPALNATVMVGDAIVWEAEGGQARQPQDGTATDYNFYSIAKMLTGLAYLRLEQDGRLDLDTPVRSIDPDLPAHYDGVTVHQLLDHSAGVRHYTSEADWIGFSDRRCALPSDALGHFIDDPLVTTPGYTTFGYVLLSHLLVTLTGQADFDAAMQDVLGEAYRAHTDREDAVKATAWVGEAGDWQAYEDLSAECKFGGGGLLASARDLAETGAALYRGEIVDPAVLAEGPAYWAGRAEEVNLTYAAHSGGSPGGRAFLIVYLEPQVSVALTGNYDGENLQALAITLADLFAGLPPAE